MALSPATFYDDNGVVRLQGQLDGGGGAGTATVYSKAITFATPNIDTVGAVWFTAPSGLFLINFYVHIVSSFDVDTYLQLIDNANVVNAWSVYVGSSPDTPNGPFTPVSIGSTSPQVMNATNQLRLLITQASAAGAATAYLEVATISTP